MTVQQGMSNDSDLLCSHCGGAITTPLVRRRTKKRGYGYCSRTCGFAAKRKPHHFERRAWVNMNSRCNNPNTPLFEHYGGRGIRVLYGNFNEFLNDVGPRPTAGHSVDRIDVNGHYEPGNCRWATGSVQARNTRFNRIVEFNGERLTVVEWAERLNVASNTITWRLRRGWSIERALSSQVNKRSTKAERACGHA